MRTVSEQLRAEDRERFRRMSPAERLREALELGEEAIVRFATAHGVDREDARRSLERAAQAGRRPSRVMREIVD